MTGERPVLVTGAAGFIGSHLVEALLRAGRRVRALVRYASHSGSGWLATIPTETSKSLEIVRGDVTDAHHVLEAARGCERIFHLAALIGIPHSYAAPASYVAANVAGTVNVLEAARATGCTRVVVASTSEVYGTARFTPITEEHPLQPQSPYAASKIGAESLALSYQRSFGLPVVVARPFNTFGPRQSTRAVIPTIITQTLHGDAIRIGNLTPIRDMVFVEDTVAGFLALAEHDACTGRAINLATGAGVSVSDLIERIALLTGRSLPCVVTEERLRPRSSEVERLIGSSALATQLTGWAPRTSLDEGLARTIAWFSGQSGLIDVHRYRT